MSRIIKLKSSTEYFEKDKHNKLEARLANFSLKKDDIIRFLEWDRKKVAFTGRFYDKKIKDFHKIRKPFHFWKKRDLNKYGIYVLELKKKPVYKNKNK